MAFCGNLRRSLSVLLVVSMFSAILLGNQASAADQPINHTEASNKISWGSGANSYSVYAASSIGFMGAEWSSARNAWAFNYRFVGTGAGRKGTDASNLIKIAAMEIEGTSNKSNLALWSSADSKYIGSAPASSGSTPGYSSLISAVAGFAITAINNLSSAYLWSVAGLVDAMRSTVNSQSSSSGYLLRSWNWTGQTHDVGQYFWFIVDVKPYQTAEISTEYTLFGDNYEVLSAGKKYRSLEAGAPNSFAAAMAKNTNDWNPGMMSNEEKEIYGVEEISREEFDKRADELNISQRSFDEFINSNDNVFYYAHNFHEYEVTPEEPNSPKDVLIHKINEQLDKSNSIIEAYSSLEEKNEEDEMIIQKHIAKQSELKEVLERAQLINESNIDSINSEIIDLETYLQN